MSQPKPAVWSQLPSNDAKEIERLRTAIANALDFLNRINGTSTVASTFINITSARHELGCNRGNQ
jgi:hypothetical protein